jgi:hypothetical protein
LHRRFALAVGFKVRRACHSGGCRARATDSERRTSKNTRNRTTSFP